MSYGVSWRCLLSGSGVVIILIVNTGEESTHETRAELTYSVAGKKSASASCGGRDDVSARINR